jgi:hypothetical protein
MYENTLRQLSFLLSNNSGLLLLLLLPPLTKAEAAGKKIGIISAHAIKCHQHSL